MKAMDPQAESQDPDIERKNRERGAVLDMPFTQSICCRCWIINDETVSVQYDVRYGEDPRHVLMSTDRPDPRRQTVMVLARGAASFAAIRAIAITSASSSPRRLPSARCHHRLAPAHQWPAGAQDAIAVYQWRGRARRTGRRSAHLLVGESAGAARCPQQCVASTRRRDWPSRGRS